MLYKTAAGPNIETYFESWDFNIYPAANTVRYPEPGETFRVIYLSGFPNAFLIATDETSEYKRIVDCERLTRDVDAARRLSEFDLKDAGVKRALDDAEKSARDAGCTE